MDWGTISQDAEDSPIIEKFDPTWPFNFKWGYDSQSGATNVWRVQGGTDGRPTHRLELKELWGRDPKVTEGDILGLASYIPPERKLDGSVVAPATVLVQAYYGQDVPDEIFDWFHTQFPDVVVRRARLASIVTGDMNWNEVPQSNDNVFKWIWSKPDGLLLWQTDSDGMPSHNQKAMAEWGRLTNETDNLGFATPVDDTVEIDCFHGSAPRGIAAVKDELKKLFPDANVDASQLTFDYEPQFHGDPGKLARRMSAIAWANENLVVPSDTPLGDAESHAEPSVQEPGVGAWLSRFLTKRKTAEADMEGAMVGLFLTEDDAKKIQIKGGEPLESIHITLCYFTDKAADRDDWDEVVKICEQIAAQTPPLTGKVSGYGVFSNDVDVLWASPSVQGLAELRHKIYEACEDAGFHVDTTHDWAPHITLKYDHKGKLPKLDGEVTLKFDELAFARGNEQEAAKFTGHFEKEAVWGAQDRDGWQGAHRFITDGKEVLTKPYSTYDDGNLAQHFRTLHPDTELTSEGLAAPTADNMGFGAWHSGGDVPLHELIKVLDKHLEKPTHLVDSPADLADPQRYRLGLPD